MTVRQLVKFDRPPFWPGLLYKTMRTSIVTIVLLEISNDVSRDKGGFELLFNQLKMLSFAPFSEREPTMDVDLF